MHCLPTSFFLLSLFLGCCVFAQPRAPPLPPGPDMGNPVGGNSDPVSQFFNVQQAGPFAPNGPAAPPGPPGAAPFNTQQAGPSPMPTLGPQGFPNLNNNLGGGFGSSNPGPIAGNGYGNVGGFGAAPAMGAGAGSPFSLANNVFSPEQISQFQQAYAASHGLNNLPSAYPGTGFGGANNFNFNPSAPTSFAGTFPGATSGNGRLAAFGNAGRPHQFRTFQATTTETPFNVPVTAQSPRYNRNQQIRTFQAGAEGYSNAPDINSNIGYAAYPSTSANANYPQQPYYQPANLNTPTSGYSSLFSNAANVANSLGAPGNPLTAPGTPLGQAFGPGSPLNSPMMSSPLYSGRQADGLDNFFNGLGQTMSSISTRISNAPPPSNVNLQGVIPGRGTGNLPTMRPTSYETTEPSVENAAVPAA